MSKTRRLPASLISRAYLRDGQAVHTGDALLLACLLHTHAPDREGSDMETIQRLMRDINFEE